MGRGGLFESQSRSLASAKSAITPSATAAMMRLIYADQIVSADKSKPASAAKIQKQNLILTLYSLATKTAATTTKAAAATTKAAEATAKAAEATAKAAKAAEVTAKAATTAAAATAAATTKATEATTAAATK